MFDFSPYAFSPAQILLPDSAVDPARWSVIACDQFTSQPEYWRQAEEIVAESPSTLRMIWPECYLSHRPADPSAIHGAMRRYLKEDILSRRVDGFVLVERSIAAGTRVGLVGRVDLEAYDYRRGASCQIRPTEGTVLDRLPPRAAIRRGAPLELPHVMLLADDPGRTLIEPLYRRRGEMEQLYDFDLMLGGGHVRGWRVDDPAIVESFGRALAAYAAGRDGFLFATGDGNHSLAAARLCWEEVREQLSREERLEHPARYALVELDNLYDPSLNFEPIHRAVFPGSVPAEELRRDFDTWLGARGMRAVPCATAEADIVMDGVAIQIENAVNPMPLAILQPFLDDWLRSHPGTGIDYIHGADALEAMQVFRFQLNRIDKYTLFDAVRKGGALPRKSFSIGEAREKRYYLECRALFA